MPDSPHVAVVVLSWNGRDDTLACLESVGRVGYEPLTTILVDNASTDQTVAAVRDRFASATIVENEANLGYAGGMNVGIERALADGADTIVPPSPRTALRKHDSS